MLSQMAAIGGACIGEDLMNFEFNQHLMIGEIEKNMPDGRVKILDLSWSPITDEADTIIRLMLCVRDVTELRQLAAEASEQKRELEMIGEILAVSQEKFHEFIAGSLKFVDENEAVIRQNPVANGFAVAKLFRNMHTIKGNSRTYGLLHLADIVHDAEQHYEALRKADADIAWDRALLLTELAGVKATLQRYAHINEVTLGREGAGRRNNQSERYLTIDKQHIQDTLQRLENVNTANLHELVSVRNAVRKTLLLLGTEPITDLLAGVFESLPALADDLGKAAPIVAIDDGGYVLHSQNGNLLKNVFMHLIRNAMDHGLETPEQRLAQGKPAAGAIRLAMQVEDDMLRITLRDDGRGLALGRIRKIALEKDMVRADEQIGDDAMARLIMRPGFSTSEQITAISGRGVGMDAVLEFVTGEGGDIQIRFDDDAVGADFRQFSVIVVLPAHFAVRIDATHFSDANEHRMMAVSPSADALSAIDQTDLAEPGDAQVA